MRKIQDKAFAATMIRHRIAINEASAAIIALQPKYARWQPVYADICQRTIDRIIDTQDAIKKLLTFATSTVCSSVSIEKVIVSFRSAMEKGDEAAIIIRAYAPISHTVTENALRELKRARITLQSFMEEVQTGMREVHAAFPIITEDNTRITIVREIPPLLLLPAPQDDQEESTHND